MASQRAEQLWRAYLEDRLRKEAALNLGLRMLKHTLPFATKAVSGVNAASKAVAPAAAKAMGGVQTAAKTVAPVAANAVRKAAPVAARAAKGTLLPGYIKRPLTAAGLTAAGGLGLETYYDLKPAMDDPGMAMANAAQKPMGLTTPQTARLGQDVAKRLSSNGFMTNMRQVAPFLLNQAAESRLTKPQDASHTAARFGTLAGVVANPVSAAASAAMWPAIKAVTPSTEDLTRQEWLRRLVESGQETTTSLP